MKRVFSTVMVILCLLVAGNLLGQQARPARGQLGAANTGAASAAEPGVAPSAQAAAQAVVPRLIMFNGVLQDLSGKPLSGPVDVTFALYSDQAGGSPLWFETQTVQASSRGHYTVLLGAMSPAGVPMDLFTSGLAHWLGVQVSNLPEQSRVLLVSVPYALKAGDAETLGGKPASAYMLSSSESETDTSGTTNTTVVTSSSTDTTTTNSTPITQATTQNYIPKFADSGGTLTDSAMFQSGNNIGINTDAPAFGLDLNSNVFAVGTKSAAPGAGGTMRFRDDTGTVRWLFGVPGTAASQDFFMYNYTNGHAPLFIENGAPSYSFYFTTAGNVGVGTNAPSFPLDVNGNILGVGTKTARPGFGGVVQLRDDTGTARWALGLPSTSGATGFRITDVANSHDVVTIDTGAPASTMVLKDTGHVGIGTSEPKPTFHVVTAGTTPSIFTLAGDAIAGECSGDSCAGVDAIGLGTSSIGLYAQGPAGGYAADIEGHLYVTGDVEMSKAGGTIFMMNANRDHCALVGLDDNGALVASPTTCPTKRTLRGRRRGAR